MSQQTVLIVCPYLDEDIRPPANGHKVLPRQAAHDSAEDEINYKMSEAAGLCHAIYLDPVHKVPLRVRQITPAYFIGTGQADRIKTKVKKFDPNLIYFDYNLSPIQQRNLQRLWDKQVVDRTGLILEIFSERAETNEGKIQVELAHLSYQKSRLVRAWSHLERQRGGTGVVGGPGERQLELDRRMLDAKSKTLKKKLEKIKTNREIQRNARESIPYPVVALVGYTNAGKSTMFNTLTNESVLSRDMLFATLDPTLRSVELPSGQTVILADTVGFITDLPTELIAAFKATLEEVSRARLVVHIQDVTSPKRHDQAKVVEETLKDLDVDPYDDDRMITVWNKIDALEPESKRRLNNMLRNEQHDYPNLVAASGLEGDGLDGLLQLIDQKLTEDHLEKDVALTPNQGREMSWLYEHCDVLDRDTAKDGTINMQIKISSKNWERFKSL